MHRRLAFQMDCSMWESTRPLRSIQFTTWRSAREQQSGQHFVVHRCTKTRALHATPISHRKSHVWDCAFCYERGATMTTLFVDLSLRQSHFPPFCYDWPSCEGEKWKSYIAAFLNWSASIKISKKPSNWLNYEQLQRTNWNTTTD